MERNGLRTLLVRNHFLVTYSVDSGLVFQNISSGLTTMVRGLPERTKFGLTYIEALDSYFLFGGLDNKRQYCNDLWQIKNDVAEKKHGKNFPEPRASCSLLPMAKGFGIYGGA
jgi:hypothetical protein